MYARGVAAGVASALDEAAVPIDALEAVAVTAGPGLVGSLLVGLSFGKALAYRLGIPVVGVHHLAGHLAVGQPCADLRQRDAARRRAAPGPLRGAAALPVRAARNVLGDVADHDPRLQGEHGDNVRGRMRGGRG